MKVLFERSFYRDLKRVHNKSVREQIQQIIVAVKHASSPAQIPHLTKMRGYETFYRIRLGDYRLGIEILNDTVIFVRCLHRRDIYRFFP